MCHVPGISQGSVATLDDVIVANVCMYDSRGERILKVGQPSTKLRTRVRWHLFDSAANGYVVFCTTLYVCTSAISSPIFSFC